MGHKEVFVFTLCQKHFYFYFKDFLCVFNSWLVQKDNKYVESEMSRYTSAKYQTKHICLTHDFMDSLLN